MLLIGKRYKDILAEPLYIIGITPGWLPDHTAVDDRLAGHADLMVWGTAEHIVAAPAVYEDIVNILSNSTFSGRIEKSAPQDRQYPHDCGLCVRSVGLYDIFNPETIDPAVRNLLRGTPIHTRQGYAACSVCAVSDDAVITSDHGIAAAAPTRVT